MTDRATPMAGQSPAKLLSMLRGWTGKKPEMSHLLLVSMGMLPVADATPDFWHDLNKVLGNCHERNGGTVFDLSESERSVLINMNEYKEIVITTDLRVDLLRLIQRHFPDYFGLVDQSRLLRVVNLTKRLANAIALVERFQVVETKKEAAAPARLRSLHVNDIKLLEDVSNELGPRDFARAFVRHQELAEIQPGTKPVAVMREYYASMDLLKRHALRGVEMRGSGNLFNQLTILLDQIVIASFQQADAEGARCSINMNVESVFTRGFEEFLNSNGGNLSNMLFEFRQANILQNFDEFSVACDLIRARGGRIAVDAIFPETVGLVNLNRLHIEMAKVFWRQGAEVTLPKARDDIRALQDGGTRFAFVRVDDQGAIDVGHDLGVTLFLGFYVDRLLAGFDPNAA